MDNLQLDSRNCFLESTCKSPHGSFQSGDLRWTAAYNHSTLCQTYFDHPDIGCESNILQNSQFNSSNSLPSPRGGLLLKLVLASLVDRTFENPFTTLTCKMETVRVLQYFFQCSVVTVL